MGIPEYILILYEPRGGHISLPSLKLYQDFRSNLNHSSRHFRFWADQRWHKWVFGSTPFLKFRLEPQFRSFANDCKATVEAHISSLCIAYVFDYWSNYPP